MRIYDQSAFIARSLLFSGLAAVAGFAVAAQPGLGKPVSPADVAAIDISIPPSGEGLPAGSGDAVAGKAVYAEKCAACHAQAGKGKPADALVGGIGSLGSAKPVKSVGSYWPYATTLFDYIRRAMPLDAPMSLSDDEVYAVTAYVLSLNGIVSETEILDAGTLPAVRMPNRGRFNDRSGVR